MRNSFLIKISDSHMDPEAAAIVANKFVTAFIEYLMQSVGGDNDIAVNYLQERAAQLQKEEQEKQNALENYMKEKKLVSLDSSINLVADALRAVQAQLTAAELAELNARTVADQINRYQTQKRDLLEIDWIAKRPSIVSLRDQLSKLQQQQADLSDRYLERHPKMIAFNGQIAKVRNSSRPR